MFITIMYHYQVNINSGKPLEEFYNPTNLGWCASSKMIDVVDLARYHRTTTSNLSAGHCFLNIVTRKMMTEPVIEDPYPVESIMRIWAQGATLLCHSIWFADVLCCASIRCSIFIESTTRKTGSCHQRV